LAGVTVCALAVSLLTGVSSVKAEDSTAVDLKPWSFLRGGVDFNGEYLNGNEGRINSVTITDTSEVITGWNELNPAEQVKTASGISKGFDLDIKNVGWDKDWGADTINPWQIQASMKEVAAVPGHRYKVSFKTYATKAKYCYVAFGCTVDGYDMTPYDEAGLEKEVFAEGGVQSGADSSNQYMSILNEETHTYYFTNWVSAQSFKVTFMLGNFSSDSKKGYGGVDISDVYTSPDNGYQGVVSVRDFTITDLGKNPDFVEVPTVWNDDTTKAEPTTKKQVTPVTKPATVKKFAQVKKVKAKAKKKGKVSISWKKIAKVKKYQIKVGSKTFYSKTNKKTVKIKGKAGKTLKVKVRAKAANGYKTGKWSKTVKVKIKK
ncbi:MAG: hypothetical protein K6G85_04720, partial [Eubacterium sp.]|nr:hypothetical protein [Eubacterium sp.]